VYYPVYTPPVLVETPAYIVSDPAPQVAMVSEPVVEPAYAAAVTPAVATSANYVFSVPAGQIESMISDGSQLFRDGEYERAGDLFLRAATADPQNTDARLAYGMARFALGDYATAAEALRQGVRIAPDVVNSAFDLRDNYGNAEDFERQGGRLAEWVQANPADADALLVLGFVCHFTGDRPDSTAIFSQIKVQSPADADIAEVFLSAQAVP
jgi:tetratricopeptide (TPR) repeat protein